jgi:hypothetical protein
MDATRQVRQLSRLSSRRIDHKKLRILPFKRDKRELLPVRAPADTAARGLPGRDLSLPAAVEVHDVEVWRPFLA